MWYDTCIISLSSGTGIGDSSLTAFESALSDAGVADFNLILLSSIIPRGIPIDQTALRDHAPLDANGRFLPAVYCQSESNTPGATIAAAVGVGIPKDSNSSVGVVFRFAGTCSKAVAEENVRLMIEEAFKHRGVKHFTLRIAAAETVVFEKWGCAFACAAYCNEELQRQLA